MLSIQYKVALLALGLIASLPTLTNAAIETAQGEITGEISLVSKYIYRGGEENDKLGVQGGLEYAHHSGWNIGYWGSTLNYQPKNDKDHGFEHDLYVGYGRELNDNWSYATQIVTYIYQGGGKIYSEDATEKRRTTGAELINSLNYKDLSLGVAVMLSDVDYANAGDVYLSAAYSYPLPQDFALNSSVGFSIYNKHRDDAVVSTTKSTQFSEARVGLSKDFADSGVSMALDYVRGGQDRYQADFAEHVLLGINYSF